MLITDLGKNFYIILEVVEVRNQVKGVHCNREVLGSLKN